LPRTRTETPGKKEQQGLLDAARDRPGPSSNLQEEDGEERESQKTSEPRQQPQKARGTHLTNSNSKLARNDQSKSNTFIEKRNLFRSERRTLRKDNHSRFTNRTTTIKMALLVILLLIGQASGQSVQISLPGGSVDTTATATAMPGIVESGVDLLPDSMRVGNSVNIVAGVIRGVTATSPDLKVFAFYGLVVCQVRKGTIVDTKALAIQDPLKIYIGESPASASSAKIFYFTMSYSNPNWLILEAAQPALTTTPANGSLASFSGPKTSWPGTQIVYFGQTGAQMFELNFAAGTQGQEKAITGTGANLIAGKMRFMQKTATDGLLFATESNSNIYIVNRTNMQLTEAWTTTAVPTYGMTNNLDETQLLYILSNLMTVKKGELTSGGASVVDLLSHAVTEGNITFLLNFGSYNYLGVSVASAQPFMRILEKPTMTKMIDLAGVSKTNSFLNAWIYISGNTSFFGTFRDTGSFNFQSWQINFNNCLVRDAAFICQTCSNASMLKTSLAAYNQCIDQFSVPFRNGKDTSDSTYKPCATGCNNCLANYLNCTACDYTAASPNDYWLDGTVCVQGTAITGAKGKNTVMNGILTACQTTNCTQCKSDYRVCEACDAANDWWLNGTSCVNTAGIPLGMGKLGSTGKLAPCAFGCTNCQGNSTQCSVCDTSKDYWMLNNVCVVGGLLPIGFGRKIGTTVADMCVSGCLNCNANSNQCFSCDTSSGVDKWIRNQICVDGSSLPAGEGRNLSQGIISPCTAIGCQDCKTSHLTCALCDKPNGYWLLNNSCITEANISPGFGKKDSDGTIQPCSATIATGCLDCKSNFAACSKCDKDNDFWLDTGACLAGSAIPSLKGRKLSNGTVDICSVAGCLDCKTNTLSCTQCDQANGFWLDNGTCVPEASIGALKGKTPTGTLATCTTTGCLDCKQDYTKCAVCDKVNNWWLLTDTCVLGVLIPAGKGKRDSDGTVQPCSGIVGCLECQANHTGCTKCDQATDFWFDSGTCVQGSSIGALKGKTPTGTLATCTTTGCLDCKQDYAKCAVCDKVNNWWLLTDTCVLGTLVPEGKGKKDSDGTIQPCSATIATGCLDCKSNFAACSKCDKDNDFWLDTGACLAGSAIPSLKGRKLSNGTVDICSVAGCLDCKTNTLSCTQCDQANGFWLDNGTCVPEASIGALKGKTPTGTLATCTTTGCLDCKQDYTKCAVCDKVNNWWLLTDTCVLGVLIPAGKGKRDSDGTVQPCSGIVGCLECQANHTGCTKCDQATDFWFDSGTCVQGSSIGALKGKTPTGTLATCTTTGCLDCKQDYAKCAVCDKVNNWWLLTDTCVLGTLVPEGKGKKDSDGTIQPCSATIATGCLDCKSNFAACSKCDKDNDFWLDTGACLAGSAIPSLKGRKLSNGTVDICSVAGCLDCKTNTLSCTQCDQANGFWLDNGTCVPEASIGALKGKTPTGTLATCTTTGCLDCKQDYTKCAVCDKVNNWWLLTDTCVLGVLIPAGKGKRDSDGTVQPCSGIVGCLECQANHTGCTKCDQATDFWFDSGTCVAGSNIPITKGRQTFDGSLVACQSGGCLDCKTSFSVCVECDKNNDWWLEDKVCIRGPNIGQFKGKNLLEGKVSPCTPSAGCLDCQENHSSCAACDTSTDWWFNTNGCIKGTTIPGGKGKNSALGRVEACSLGCLACLSDFRKCTQCNSAADFWLENDQCKAGGDIGLGKGRKPSDGTLASCTSGVGCLNCLTNNAICQICDRNNDWWLESGTCIAGTSLSPGKGRNLQTGMVSPCSLSGCLFCHADYTDCKRLDCLTSNNLWLDEQANICIPIANIPSGKGPNLTLGTVVPCASAACRDCGQDHLKCTKCDVASGFWLFENGCYQKSSFAGLPKADASVGLGVNYESGIVSPCRISNCSNCEDFFGLCAQCNSGYDLVNQLCTCKSASNCSECGPIPGSCTKCESNYLLIAGKCERPTEEFKLELHTLFFDLTKSEAEVTFRDMINTVNPEDLEITLIDLEESEQGTPFDCATVPSLETPSTKDCKIQLTPFEDGFKFKLAMSKQINKGKIVITPRRKSIIYGMNQKAVAQFPIEIKDVVYNESSTKKAMTSLAEGASATTNYAAIVANIVLIPFKGAMSVLLDYLLAEMLYLNLMNGPLLIYPSIILDALKDKNQPLPNIFQSWIGGRDCSVLDNFQRNGIACSIFDNFGSVILKLAIILLATTIITMITRAYFKKVQPELDAQEKEEAKQKYLDEAANTNPKMEGNGLVEQVKNRDVIQSGGKEQPMTTVANEKALDSDTPTKIQDSAAFKIMTLLATSFGMKFFVVQMEGLVLRIFRVSLVNLFSEPNDVTLAIGAIICFLIVGYYACYGYYILQFAKEARLQLENLDPKPDAIELSKTKKLCDKLNEKDLKYGMLLFLYQDLKFPSSYFHLYEPFARLMRALCIYICVIGFYTAGITQVIALLLVEIVYSTYIIKTRQKFLCWRNLLDVINRIGFVVYLILKLVSFIGFSEDRKQNIHGLVMAIVLLLLILTNLVIVIVAMIIMVINLIREKLAERKAAAKKAEEDKAKANNKLEVLADAEAVKIKNEEAQSARPLLEFKGPVIMGNVE
jgi:hypothetical protein